MNFAISNHVSEHGASHSCLEGLRYLGHFDMEKQQWFSANFRVSDRKLLDAKFYTFLTYSFQVNGTLSLVSQPKSKPLHTRAALICSKQSTALFKLYLNSPLLKTLPYLYVLVLFGRVLYGFFVGILPFCSKLITLTFWDSRLVLVGLWLMGFINSLGHAGK